MGVKKIGKYMIALLSVIIYLVLSSTPVHAAVKPLGRYYGGDNIDLGVYTKTLQKKFYTWTNCGDHDMMPPDDDNRYLVTYDQYDFYEGLEQYKSRGTKPGKLYSNRDALVAAWFALSEDSDVLLDYYRDTVFGGKTPNDIFDSSFSTFKRGEREFTAAGGNEENFRYNSAQTITWYYANGYDIGRWYTKTNFSQKALDFSKKYPVSEETARALNVQIIDSNNQTVNNQNPLKVDSATRLTDSFRLTGYGYPVRADLTNMPYKIIDSSGKELVNKASSTDQKKGKIYVYILPNQEYRVEVKEGTN